MVEPPQVRIATANPRGFKDPRSGAALAQRGSSRRPDQSDGVLRTTSEASRPSVQETTRRAKRSTVSPSAATAPTLRLFETQQLTLAQAAKLAAVSTEDFMALAGAACVVVMDYPPEELREEMATARPRQ